MDWKETPWFLLILTIKHSNMKTGWHFRVERSHIFYSPGVIQNIQGVNIFLFLLLYDPSISILEPSILQITQCQESEKDRKFPILCRMRREGHKNPSKFYKFMIGELSGAWGHSCYGLQTTHLNKPGRVLSECRHGHISAPVLFEWGYNESCWERQAIGTFDNCWDESELFLKVWMKGV